MLAFCYVVVCGFLFITVSLELKVLRLLLGRIWLGYHWCFSVGARSCGEESRIETEG